MNTKLRTPHGSLLINLTKINGIDLRDNCIIILYTSEKANNLSFTYNSKEDATRAFDCLYERIKSLSF